MTPQDKITLKKLNRLVNARLVIPLLGVVLGFIIFVIIGVSISVNFPDKRYEILFYPFVVFSYGLSVWSVDVVTQKFLKTDFLLTQPYSEEIQTAFYQMHDITLADFRAYLRLKKRNRLWIPLVSLILLPLCWIPYLILNNVWILLPSVRAITPKHFRSQKRCECIHDIPRSSSRHPYSHFNPTSPFYK